jgi:hypothetical protein
MVSLKITENDNIKVLLAILGSWRWGPYGGPDLSFFGDTSFRFCGYLSLRNSLFSQKTSTSRTYVQCTKINSFSGNGGKSENRPKLRRWDFGWVHTMVLHYVTSS